MRKEVFFFVSGNTARSSQGKSFTSNTKFFNQKLGSLSLVIAVLVEFCHEYRFETDLLNRTCV